MRGRRVARWILGSLAAVVLLALGALWFNLNVSPAPGGYLSVAEGVSYYPTCGSGPLEHNGVTWHPIYRGDWATPTAEALAASGGRGIAVGVHAVSAPPGPGDNLGRLYVYPAGRAYWVSDSGNYDEWFTVVPQTYNWVC